MLFSFLRNPCPSSGNTTYSTGIPFAFAAATISSDSTCNTLGSLLPCRTMKGFLIFFAWNKGDLLYNITESFTGSPSSVYRASRKEVHHGGMLFSVRFQLVTPKIFTPTLNSSRSEEHTSELQSRLHLVCRLLLEKK